ncbi:MAG: hypothetical protein HY904_06875 [Deltaproteobacteria bacterium]|nr:hypothetical protein [Deltaproteobacteria bacterium]
MSCGPPTGTRTALRWGIVACALGLLGSVCPPQRHAAVSLAPADGRLSWERTVSDWSRQHKVYEWMDDKIDARATYHSPAFRKSYIEHSGNFHGDFSDTARKELVELGGGEAEYFHSFFVSAYVGTQKYRQLAHSRTIWTLWLENDAGVRVRAESLKDVTINAAVAAIYPYVGRYDRGYLVRFPLADAEGRPVITRDTKRFTLRIASAYAEAELIWDLAPGSVRQDFGLPRDAGPDAGPAKKEDEGGLGGLGKILGGGN